MLMNNECIKNCLVIVKLNQIPIPDIFFYRIDKIVLL